MPDTYIGSFDDLDSEAARIISQLNAQQASAPDDEAQNN